MPRNQVLGEGNKYLLDQILGERNKYLRGWDLVLRERIKYLEDGKDSVQQYLPGMSTGEGNKNMGKGQQIRGRGLPTARVT